MTAENSVGIDPEGPLANFGEVMVVTRGGADVFPTSEHLYQLTKFMPSMRLVREAIKNAETPHKAKEKVEEKKKLIRKDWEVIRAKAMEGIMRMKVRQNVEVQAILLETGDKYIYENADAFAPKNPSVEKVEELRRWGIYQGEGENLIGVILMRIREDLVAGRKV